MSTMPDPPACDISNTGPHTRYAAEWGLASLLLAGVLTIAALLMIMVLVWYLILISQVRPGQSDVRLTAGITTTLTALFWITSIISIRCGWTGTQAAWRWCQPGGLPVAGLVLSVLAWLLWTAVAIALVMNLFDLSRRGFM